MFTFATMPVKFVGLIVLFVWCTIWCVYELTRRQDARQRISNALHLVMAVVMLLMVSTIVWKPFVGVVPLPVIIGVFALATLWFGGLATEALRAGNRYSGLHFVGHTLMFAAMTWHLCAMAAKASHMNQPDWKTQASQPGGLLWWVALIGLPFMAYLLFASVQAIRQFVRSGDSGAVAAGADGTAHAGSAAVPTCPCGPGCQCGPECSCRAAHDGADTPVQPVTTGVGGVATLATVQSATTHSCSEPRPVGSTPFRLAALSDFAMNFGMFWMSTGLLVPVLPMFAMLSF